MSRRILVAVLSALLVGTAVASTPQPVAAAAGDYAYPFYGVTPNVTQGFHSGHQAIDYGMPVGTPIYASRAGVVAYVDESQPNSGPEENKIHIDHPGAEWTAYAHLRNEGATVVEGEWVAAGQLIGFSGCSGQCTGPHLHYVLNGSGDPSLRDPSALKLNPDSYWRTGAQTLETFNDPNVRFTATTHTLYDMDSAGRPVNPVSYSPASGSWAPASRRALARASGVWLQISAGPFAGKWIRESAAAYVAIPNQWVRLEGGTHTVHNYSALHVPSGPTNFSDGDGSWGHASARTFIGGRPYLRMDGGPLDGKWLRETARAYPAFTDDAGAQVNRTIYFDGGQSYSGCSYNADGDPSGCEGLSPASATNAPARGQVWINGTYYWRITAGLWQDQFVRSSAYAYESGSHTLHFDAGTYTGIRFGGADGSTRLGATTASVGNGSAPANRRSMINGQNYYRVSAGVFSGYWMAESNAVFEP